MKAILLFGIPGPSEFIIIAGFFLVLYLGIRFLPGLISQLAKRIREFKRGLNGNR